MHVYCIHSLVMIRPLSQGALHIPSCDVTSAWVAKFSSEALNSAFMHIKYWLPNGWAGNVEKKRRKLQSVAKPLY